MSATSPLDAPQPSASAPPAPALPLREPLLDPFVCGIREIDEPLPALRSSPIRSASVALSR